VYFLLKTLNDFDSNPTNISRVTCWKMSIEVILKAAEYLERRERGKSRRLSIFSHSKMSLIADVVCCFL